MTLCSRRILSISACLFLAVFTSAIAQADSISLGGGATLSFSHMYNTNTCWAGMAINYQYETWDNFRFRDQYGSTQSIPAGATYYHSENCQQGPPPGPNPPVGYITLSGTDSHGSKFVITFNFVANTGSIYYPPPPVKGYINPKYVVIGVTYAPPGHSSTVSYTDTTMVGNSTTLTDSFAQETTASISVTKEFVKNSVTGSSSTTYMQQSDSFTSVAINKSKSVGLIVPGPASSAEGVNHDYDVVWIWLNPILNFTIFPDQPNRVEWDGYSFDPTDIPELDIYGVHLGYLTGKWPMPPDMLDTLGRDWASLQIWPDGEGPGLTGDDVAAIAAADPFSDPAYKATVTPGTLTSTDGRFTVTANQNISYVPPGPGGQPYTQTYTANYSETHTEGKNYERKFIQTFSMEEKFGFSVFGIGFRATLKQEDKLTWGHKFNQTNTNVTGQTAGFSVTGPAYQDYYIGPTEFLVFQDNLYGTFMFNPDGPVPVSIAVTPVNPSTTPGSTVQMTAVATYNDGSTNDVSAFVKWTSSNTNVATVSNTGLVTAVAAGTATIQASSASMVGSATLKVEARLMTIAVTPVNPSIARGATRQFTATGTYSDSSTRDLTNSVAWTSSNTGVATITAAGLATGVAAGTTTIQATSGAIAGATGLTVTGSAAPVINSLSPTSGTVNTRVTISGSNFGATRGSSTVTFNGKAVTSYVSWSGTSIRVRVPSGATTGNVVVKVNGVDSNGQLFTVR